MNTTTTTWHRLPRHPAARLDDVPQRIRDAFRARLPDGPAGECWPYGRIPEHYGSVQWRDDTGRLRTIAAHRLAYMLAHGEDIPAGALVLHGCDVPACCNPAHLRLGTHADNQRDAIQRGRWVYVPPSVPRQRYCVPARPGTVGRH